MPTNRHMGLQDSDSEDDDQAFRVVAAPDATTPSPTSSDNGWFREQHRQFSNIVPTSAVAIAQERNESLAHSDEPVDEPLDLDYDDDEDSENPDSDCCYWCGHSGCLMDRVWFSNKKVLAAYHEHVHPFMRSQHQKTVFVAMWYVVLCLLALAFGLCCWSLSAIQGCGVNASTEAINAAGGSSPGGDNLLGDPENGDDDHHVHEERGGVHKFADDVGAIVLSTNLKSFVNVSGFEFDVDLDSVRFLRVGLTALLISAFCVGPVGVGVLYLPSCERLMRTHWMDFLGCMIVIL